MALNKQFAQREKTLYLLSDWARDKAIVRIHISFTSDKKTRGCDVFENRKKTFADKSHERGVCARSRGEEEQKVNALGVSVDAISYFRLKP